METTKRTGVTIRMRRLMTHTLKDGWRVSETSVEVTDEVPYDRSMQDVDSQIRTLGILMNDAERDMHRRGIEEARRRNETDDGSAGTAG